MSWSPLIKAVLESPDNYEYYLRTEDGKNTLLVDKSYLSFEKLLPRVKVEESKVYFVLPFSDRSLFALFVHGINDYSKDTIRELYGKVDYIGESALTHKVILKIGYKYRHPIYIRSMRTEYVNRKYPNLTGLALDLKQEIPTVESQSYADILELLICPNFYRYVLTSNIFKISYMAAEPSVQAQYLYAYAHTIMYAYIHEVLSRRDREANLKEMMFTLDEVNNWLVLNCNQIVSSPYTPFFFNLTKYGAELPYKHVKILSSREEFNNLLIERLPPTAYKIMSDVLESQIGVLFGPVLTQALFKCNPIRSQVIDILTPDLETIPFFLITALQKYSIIKYDIIATADRISFYFNDQDNSNEKSIINFIRTLDIQRHVLTAGASCDRAYYDGKQVYMFASCAITSMNGGMLLENNVGEYSQNNFNRMTGQYKLSSMTTVGIQDENGIVHGFNSHGLKSASFDCTPTQEALDALEPIIDEDSDEEQSIASASEEEILDSVSSSSESESESVNDSDEE